MLSIQETKKGGVAIIFGKEYADKAKEVYPVIAEHVLSTKGAIREKGRSLNDVITSVEGAQTKQLPKRSYVKSAVPRTTTGVPSDPKEIRQSIHELVTELCTSDGMKYGLAWRKAYRLLSKATGFDVYKVALINKDGHPSKIQTVIDSGKGGDMIRALQNYLDK